MSKGPGLCLHLLKKEKNSYTCRISIFCFLGNLTSGNESQKGKENMVMCCQQQIISSFLFRIIFNSFILFTLLNHLPTNSFHRKNYKNNKKRYWWRFSIQTGGELVEPGQRDKWNQVKKKKEKLCEWNQRLTHLKHTFHE